MVGQSDYHPLTTPADEEGLKKILLQSFAFPEKDWKTYFERVGRENFRVIEDDGEIRGGLAVVHMGQWFGGRSIPMGGIAAVGVAPHQRGAGVAVRLMERVVTELHEDQFALSVLYPATMALYRMAGYEMAGRMCLFSVPTTSILLRERELPVTPIDLKNTKPLEDLARARAMINSGNLDRNQTMWSHLCNADDNPVYGYLIGPTESPEGYVIFIQKHEEWGYDIRVRDMLATTRRAGLRLWSFLASHSMQTRDIYWRGPAAEPLLLLLPEPIQRVKQSEFWMLRILDVQKALSMRGYPPEVEAELHLEVADQLLPANNGCFTVKAAGGRAEVAAGGRGELRLDIRSLAPMYSGMTTPAQLEALGALQATEDAIMQATRLFAGPEPWMPDVF